MARKKKSGLMKGKFIDDLEVVGSSWVCHQCAHEYSGKWRSRSRPTVAYFGKCCICGLVAVLSTVDDYLWLRPEEDGP